MRIAHVVVGLDPALGGPPAVALRLAAAQAGAGHAVSLVAHDAPDCRDQIAQSLRAIPRIGEVTIVALPPKPRSAWRISAATRRALSETLVGVDVVHLHGLWESLVRIAALECWHLHKPYILTPHGVLDPWSLRQRWLKKRLAMMLVYRRVLRRASRLHMLNDDEAALIQPLGAMPPNVVIPNGVFLEEIEPLPPSGTFRAAHPGLGDKPYILFLSRLHYKKGLDYLADAFSEVSAAMPEVQLVVAGPDGGAEADFKRRIREAGLIDRTHVVGPLWGSDKLAAMVDAICFCLPSRQEGFSMAITEAMACGLPVVITDACHFPEVAAAGAGEIVQLGASSVAAGLLRVLGNADRAAGMGAAGRDLVRARYTWPVIGRRAVETYMQMMAEHV